VFEAVAGQLNVFCYRIDTNYMDVTSSNFNFFWMALVLRYSAFTANICLPIFQFQYLYCGSNMSQTGISDEFGKRRTGTGHTKSAFIFCTNKNILSSEEHRILVHLIYEL